MKKFLKYSIASLVVIIALLMIIPAFISLDRYKSIVINQVRELTGRELQINGKMTFSLLPSPSITIKNIALSSVAGGHYPNLFEAKEITSSVTIFSLIRGKIDISEIRINNPIINLERLQNGSASWEFSSKTQNNLSSNTENGNRNKTDSSLAINLIKIIDGKVNYADFKTNDPSKTDSVKTVEIDKLEVKDFHGPSDLSCQLYSSGKDYNLKSNIKEKRGVISLEINLTALKEKINLTGEFNRDNLSLIGKLKLKGSAKILQLAFPDMQIADDFDHKLTFNIEGNKKIIKINDLDFTVDKSLVVKGNANFYLDTNQIDLAIKLNPGDIDITLSPLSLAPLSASDNSFNENLSVKILSLKNLLDVLPIDIKKLPINLLTQPINLTTNVTYLDQDLTLNNIDLAIAQANLAGKVIVKNLCKIPAVSYDIKITGAPYIASLLGIELPVNIDDLLVKGETIKDQEIIKTNNTVIIANTTNNIKGTISLGDSIKPNIIIESSGNNLGQTIALLTKTLANNSLGSYNISSQIEGDLAKILKIDISNANFNLKGTNTNLSGRLTGDFAVAKPKITTDLKITTVNLDALSTEPIKSSPTTSQVQDDRSSAPWSQNKIDLSFLNKFDADMTIIIQKIITSNLNFDNTKISAIVTNGILNIKSLNSKLYGGVLEASGQISSQTTQPINFKASLKGAELKNLVQQQSNKIKVTQGTINFAVDVKTKGTSQIQYVNNLFGSAELSAVNGKVSGFDLQKILDGLKNLNNLDGILRMLDVSFSEGETNFQNLDFATNIKDGVANITKCKLTAPLSALIVSGTINLPKYTLDTEGTITIDIKSIPPFKAHVFGYLNNPQHTLDTKALQQYLAKNLVNNVVEGIKNGKKPEELLKDIIGVGKNRTNQSEDSSTSQQEATSKEDQAKELQSTIQKGLKELFK